MRRPARFLAGGRAASAAIVSMAVATVAFPPDPATLPRAPEVRTFGSRLRPPRLRPPTIRMPRFPVPRLRPPRIRLPMMPGYR